MRATMWAALLTCALVPPAHSKSAAPATVGVAIADKRPIARTIDFVGRVEAINRVEVRARVTGYLDAVLFKEGDLVKEGAALTASRRACSRPRSSRPKARWSEQGRKELAIEKRQRAEDLTQERQRRQSPGRSRRIGGRDQGRHPDQ